MANIDKAFSTELLALDDTVLLTQGSDDPTIGIGYEAPIGSLYLRTNGSVYRKVDTADVDWKEIDGIDASNVFAAMKEPTGHEDRADSTISFVDGTRVFSIVPVGSYDYYIHGTKHTITTTKNITIPDVTGSYYIYLDAAETLQYQSTFTIDLLLDEAYTGIVYWNATTGEGTYVADERHGITMDGQTHLHLHNSLGTQFISGLAMFNIVADGDGDSDSHAQCAVANGTIRDEDIAHDIYDTGGGVNVYDLVQELDPIANIPVLYRVGATGVWTKKAGDAYPLIYGGVGYTGTRPAWNEFTGATWQLTEVTNNRFVLMHILATNDINNPIVAICGINEYQNKPQGRDAALAELNQLSGLPFAEFTPIGTIIYQTSDGYASTPVARIRTTNDGEDYVDWRDIDSFSNVGAGGALTYHGNLGGLLEDDHTQYALAGSGSTRTFDIDDLNDVTLTTPVNDQVLTYSGGQWINATNAAADTGITELTGDVTAGPGSGSQAATIALDAVTYAKMQNVVADDVLLGNIAGAGGPVAELTATQVRTLLNVESGAAADQNLWETITGDTGTATANTTTDSFDIGGTTDQITTAITGDALVIALASNTVIPGNEALGIPTGTTLERPASPATGDMRFNTTLGTYEAWDGSSWLVFGATAGSGVKEILYGQLGHISGTTQIPFDNTAPLVTEGTQFFSQSVTTTTGGGRIVLWFSTIVSVSNSSRVATVSMFRDSTLIGVTAIQVPSSNSPQTSTFIVVDAPGVAGTYTYTGRIGVSASATWRVGGFTSKANYGGATNTNNQYVLMRIE